MFILCEKMYEKKLNGLLLLGIILISGVDSDVLNIRNINEDIEYFEKGNVCLYLNLFFEDEIKYNCEIKEKFDFYEDCLDK